MIFKGTQAQIAEEELAEAAAKEGKSTAKRGHYYHYNCY